MSPSPSRSPHPKSNGVSISSNIQHSPRSSSISLGYSYGQKSESSSFAYKISPGRSSNGNGVVRNASASTSRRLTPSSSTSSSPHHLPVSLPPTVPRMCVIVGRRGSVDSIASNRPSVHRRTSMSMSIHSSTNASPNLRNIGEGVLDDSDSTSSGSDGDEGGETAGVKSSDPEISHRSLHSPLLSSLRMTPAPSPLSRVVGHHAWTEDELDRESNDDDDNASSPSPQSTETDSDETRSTNKPKLSRTNSERLKSRSRSSTIASLVLPRPLMHQDSRSSIRTVTAGETFLNGQEGSNGFQPENSSPHQRSITGHGRQRSLAVSEFMLNGTKSAFMADQDEKNDSPDDSPLSERRIETIAVEDMRFKETTLCALREALEVLVEEV